MNQDLRKTFQTAAVPPSEILDRARSCADDVRNLLCYSLNLIRCLEAGVPICAPEVVRLIDRAEAIHLISREGMKQSGIHFVVREAAMQEKMFDITADDAMSAARHVYLQARRANNIINRKPGAYTPTDAGMLYGRNVTDWQPLIP